MNPPESAVGQERIRRLEVEVRDLDQKVDALLEDAARKDVTASMQAGIIQEIRDGLNARDEREQQERRQDRRVLIAACVTIMCTIIGALVALAAAGAL